MKNNLQEVCKIYDLGTVINEATRVYGGLIHKMWRVGTDKAYYAVKQLDPEIDVRYEATRKNYDISEYIAGRFRDHGIPAIGALGKDGKYLVMVNGIGYLVYPWLEAKTLPMNHVSSDHAMQIPAFIAKMHLLNLDAPELEELKFDLHSSDSIIELIDRARISRCSFSDDLIKHKESIISINNDLPEMVSLLQDNVVVSHGDLDQKNVLWDAGGNPILIDWEAVRKINPCHDIVGTSLDWSGISTEFNPDLFDKMIEAYKIVGCEMDEDYYHAGFYASMSNWINWMVYNIKRSCVSEDSDSKNIGIEQMHQVIPTILRLKKLIEGKK